MPKKGEIGDDKPYLKVLIERKYREIRETKYNNERLEEEIKDVWKYNNYLTFIGLCLFAMNLVVTDWKELKAKLEKIYKEK